MVDNIRGEDASRDTEKTRLIIFIDLPRNFPGEDESLLKRYLQSIREDVRWHMGSLQQHVIGTDVVIVNNCLIDHDILDRLKQCPNLTVPAAVVSGSSEWHDLPTILKKKAFKYSTPATLVSIQPLKQAYIQQPLAHQIDIDFVGQQSGYVSHYAALIHEDVATYLLERRQDPLAFVEVYKEISEVAQRVKELANIAAQQSAQLVKVDRFSSRSTTPFENKISGPNSSTSGLGGRAPFHLTPHSTSTIGKLDDNVVTTFTNTTDIMRRFGMNPCHLHHLVGSCRKMECTHLHDQIRFTPEALQQYRLYLRVQLCPYGTTCIYGASGKCFFGHNCPAGSNCLRPGCPHEHTAPSVPAKQPVGLYKAPRPVPIDRLQIGSEKQTSFAHPANDSSVQLAQAWNQESKLPSVSPSVKHDQGEPAIPRTQVGSMIQGKHDYAVGQDKYINFKTYSHAAARHGYVTLGPTEVHNDGHEWIQSTGKLEVACGVRPY